MERLTRKSMSPSREDERARQQWAIAVRLIVTVGILAAAVLALWLWQNMQ
jgi:hypothetical protein